MSKMAFAKIFLLVLAFMIGFMTSNIYADSFNSIQTDDGTQRPSDTNLASESILSDLFSNNQAVLTDGRTDEVPSPSSWVKESQIGVYSQRVILDIEDPQWASFTDTHSMEPVLSSRSYAIEVVPESPDQINIGDIISYKSKYADGIIIHRVIDKGEDSEGVYFILKGDNNERADPGKIRFDQVQRVVVAIIY